SSATMTAGFTVVAPVAVGPASLSLAYNGKVRDRVGQGESALGPDGAPDGTLTATLSSSGGRTITTLRLNGDWPTAPGVWRTSSPGTGNWVLGVATSLDGAFLNAPGSMAVNFAVADGGSFIVFAADYQGGEFSPGRTLTLTATFSDGSTASASTVVPGGPAALTLACNSKVRDRVAPGESAPGPAGAPAGTLTAPLFFFSGRPPPTPPLFPYTTLFRSVWRTSSPGTGNWVLGVATSLDG